DAKIKKLLRERRRDPKSSRRVLAVGNNKVGGMRTHKLRQTILNNRPSRTPKNVANKKNFQKEFSVLGCQFSSSPQQLVRPPAPLNRISMVSHRSFRSDYGQLRTGS